MVCERSNKDNHKLRGKAWEISSSLSAKFISPGFFKIFIVIPQCYQHDKPNNCFPKLYKLRPDGNKISLPFYQRSFHDGSQSLLRETRAKKLSYYEKDIISRSEVIFWLLGRDIKLKKRSFDFAVNKPKAWKRKISISERSSETLKINWRSDPYIYKNSGGKI